MRLPDQVLAATPNRDEERRAEILELFEDANAIQLENAWINELHLKARRAESKRNTQTAAKRRWCRARLKATDSEAYAKLLADQKRWTAEWNRRRGRPTRAERAERLAKEYRDRNDNIRNLYLTTVQPYTEIAASVGCSVTTVRRAVRGLPRRPTYRKLSLSNVIEIRRSHSIGVDSLALLSKKYGVSVSTICDVVFGRTHVGVPGARSTPGSGVRGSECSWSKLNEEAVVSSRRCYLAGESFEAIARDCGVGPTTIKRVVYGVDWAHVTELRDEAVARRESRRVSVGKEERADYASLLNAARELGLDPPTDRAADVLLHIMSLEVDWSGLWPGAAVPRGWKKFSVLAAIRQVQREGARLDWPSAALLAYTRLRLCEMKRAEAGRSEV